MSTNLEIITSALRDIKVLDSTETPSSEDADLGLEKLNDLMASLVAEDIDLGFPPQYSLSEDFPLDPTAEAQVKPLLAVYLAEPFQAIVTESLAIRAAQAMTQLKRAGVLEVMQESSVTHAPLGERGSGLWDISTDSF